MGKKKASPQRENIVVGRRATLETVRHTPGEVETVFLAKGKFGGSDLLTYCDENNLTYREIPQDQLDEKAQHTNHQGVVLVLKKRRFWTTDELVTSLAGVERSLILALDSVSDPQNLGSLLRAAECFGASGVLWSKNRGVGITPAVTKVSAGASQLVPLVPVGNLVRELESLKKEGYWVVTTDLNASSEDLYSYEFPQKVVVVLGSEGEGVRPLVQKTADFVVKIPMSGTISSLNVAQAGAVLLAFWQQQAQAAG